MFPAGFQTPSLTLRPIAPADAGPIFDGYAQDPAVVRYLTWLPHSGIEDTHAYIARCMAATLSRTYVISTTQNDKLIGAFDLRHEASFKVGYGYCLAREAWGHGYMTEALTEIAAWVLAQDHYWRIGAVCDVDNPGSARVMEKAGLTREGLLRKWGLHPNLGPEPRDCYIYAKVRSLKFLKAASER